jgi:hypothetical protein
MASGSPGSAQRPSNVLELQRMALERAISSLDLEAAQSCTSCGTGSCNRPLTEEEAQTF